MGLGLLERAGVDTEELPPRVTGFELQRLEYVDANHTRLKMDMRVLWRGTYPATVRFIGKIRHREGPKVYPLTHKSGRKKAHKHKLFALVNVQMALGQTAGCPRVNRAKKFMCSPRNTGNINFSLWLTGGLSQGCPVFQTVYVFKVYVPFFLP